MSDSLRTSTVIGATISTGLIADLFYAYACSVMNALGHTDDRTFVDVMNKINVDIINPWFMVIFLGSGLLSIVALVSNLGSDHRRVLVWLVAATVLNVAALIVTMALNVPLNDQLATVGGQPSIAELAALREHFEGPWVRWNIVRALGHTGAFGCLTWALVLIGRASG